MAYWHQFCKRLGKDFLAATVEQVIGVLLAVGIAFFQVKYGIIHASEVHASLWAIAWPYVFLVVTLFLWHLVRTPYLLDKERAEGLEAERRGNQALKQQIAFQEKAKQNTISSSEWDALGDRFQQCSKSARVDYQITQGITRWDIKEDRTLEPLCKKAGAMLLQSPKSRLALLPMIPDEKDTLSQWLEIIKQRTVSHNIGHGIEHLDDGSSLVHTLGSIYGLAEASYQLCMECSAYEI